MVNFLFGQHTPVTPLVLNANLYFFIEGNLKILLTSRKLPTKIYSNRPKFTFVSRFVRFPRVPGVPGPPGVPRPPGVRSQKVQRVILSIQSVLPSKLTCSLKICCSFITRLSFQLQSSP